ncbi:MAG: hypothetical protein P4L71_13705 [Acetobacteraceae bacterium]|nr:hypothetical protein [Acetobacteraceae bacterium]
MLFLTVFVGLGCVSVWGFVSVQAEIARHRPREPFHSLANKFAVDPSIWDDNAPRSLRRRYILTGACTPLALLYLAHFIWNHDPRPDRLGGTILLCTFALITGGDLIRKTIRHGF